MELEADSRRLSQLSSGYSEERTGIWWVTVIVIGVFLGNLLSFGAYQLYVSWELQQLADALKTEATEQAQLSMAEMERIAKNNAALRKEREKRNAVNAQLLQTCKFWRQQVVNENTAQNRAYRDAACSRAGGSVW